MIVSGMAVRVDCFRVRRDERGSRGHPEDSEPACAGAGPEVPPTCGAGADADHTRRAVAGAAFSEIFEAFQEQCRTPIPLPGSAGDRCPVVDSGRT